MAQATGHGHHHDDGEPHFHIVSWQFMTGVFIILLIMTVLTVYTARYVDLGDMGNTLLALGIALFKGALVVGFFMHLHWDNRFNACILLYCILAMFTFFLFTTIDLGSRGLVDPVRATSVEEPKIVADAKEAAIAAGEHGDDHGGHGEGDAAPADDH